ncbi:MAG: Gfo/Idh/MocA family oxidoreductase [Pseudomonadota bacterium]
MTKILVVGAGLIGARHAARVMAHANAELVGVVDPDPERSRGHGAPGFASISDVDIPVEGVILATPTDCHAKDVDLAAERGWPVLLEKPVAGSLSDAERVIAASDKVPVLVGHHRRYHASVARLRAAVRQGGIGAPVLVSLIWSLRKPDAYFEGNWRSAGGSPVLINLVHDLDLLRHVMGEVVDLAALGGAAHRKGSRVESGGIVLRFASGAHGTIAFADTAPSPWGFEAGTAENPNIAASHQDMMWVTGTHGALSFPSLTQWSGSDSWNDPQSTTRLDAPHTVPLDAQLDHFLDVIGGADPQITAQDAAKTLALALEIEAQLHGQLDGPRG